MAYGTIDPDEAMDFLRAPLNPFPHTYQERRINDMRVKYRTYTVEYSVHEGAIMLPKMFSHDFRGEMGRIANLIDSNRNNFEILVERNNQGVYFTRGWSALRDFYNIPIGAWLVLMYAGMGQFGLSIKDRFHRLIEPPVFIPPMRFVINKHDVPPYFVEDLPLSTDLLSYSHHDSYFNLSYAKTLTYYDVCTGFLMLPYDDFGEFVFNESDTSIKLVDDCGNVWRCTLIFVTFPYRHFKLGGEWSRLVAARRLSIGGAILLGAQSSGQNESIYLMRHA